MAPIVPYDTDASTLPVLMVVFELDNPHEHHVEASVLFNWENVCGCTRMETPEERGTIDVVRPSDTEEGVDEDTTGASASPPGVGPMGLVFGRLAPHRTNAEGHYALLAKNVPGSTVSVKTWDERDLRELEQLWKQFENEGALDDGIAGRQEAHSGSVCCSASIPPHSQQQFAFALAWYCPRFVVDEVDQGNGYTNAFPHAPAVAAHALRYQPYYLQAVQDWHNRFLSSSLPRWLSKILIDSCHVFSTNTVYTRDGRFAMVETAEEPMTGALDRRFHSSLGLLLFFPRLEFLELEAFAQAEPEDDPDRLYRYLGTWSTRSPSYGPTSEELMDLGPKMVLMAYRDYCMTGRSAPLERMFPRLKYVMRYLLEKDHDGDGLPEARDFTITFDEWRFSGVNSYAASLWLAAVRAYARLARRFGEPEEARRYEDLYSKGARTFRERLWNPEGECFFFHDNANPNPGAREPAAHGCHSGQLAGQWYADFLALGDLVPGTQVRKALAAIYHNHEENPPPSSWPAFHITHYSCLEITHGDPQRGLQSVKRARDRIVKRGRIYNQPLCWNLEENLPENWGQHRHFGALAWWHVFHALQGFLLNIPDQILCLCPNLPRDMQELRVPLLSPVSFGWLNFWEEEAGGYSQRLEISFDSPVSVRTLVLRIPPNASEVVVKCLGPDGLVTVDHDTKLEGNRRTLRIRPRVELTIQETITIEVKEVTKSEFMLFD
jgi:uncharacterized protein (DUF608 family)